MEGHPEIEAVLIYEEDGKMKTWMSDGVIVKNIKNQKMPESNTNKIQQS